MRESRRTLRWLPAVLAGCLVAAPGVPAESVQLENRHLAVSVSLATGGIERLVRKASGHEHRNVDAPAEIVRLRIPLEHWDGHAVSGSAAHAIRVGQRSEHELTLEIDGFDDREGQWPLHVRLHYRLQDDNLVLRLSMENRGGRAVDQVAFPLLGVPPAADGAERLVTAYGPMPVRYFFSANTVRTRHSPFERLDPADLRGWFHMDPAISAKAFAYPTGLSRLPTAWISYEAGGEAIGWDVRDQRLQVQYAVIERELDRDDTSIADNRQTYRLAWHWYPEIAPGATWDSPEVWLKAGAADWHAVANQHRTWFETWAQKPQRPAAFKSSLGWISQGVGHFDQIPEIAQRGVRVGAPYFIVYGWFGYGMGRLSYDYHPRPLHGGVESLRRNLARARELGAYPLAWFNGTTSVEPRPEHLQFGKDWLVVDRSGGLRVDGRWSLFDPDRPQTADDNVVHFDFDMATPARDYLLESVRRMIQDYGFSGFEMDQAGKIFLSYRAGSGSAPALGSAEGTREIYAQSVRIVRESSPDGIVVAEGISDFMSQYFDAFWLFEGGDDPFDGPGSWVDSTTYLRYSIPHGLVPTRAQPENLGHANEAFMLNAPLDIFANLDDYPDYAAHLQRLHALKREIHPFLFDGMFCDQEGFTLSGHDAASVLARSYRAESRDAVVVINRSGTPQEASVPFEPAGPGRVRQYRLSEPGAAAVDSGAGERPQVVLRLAPHDVVVLVADREARR